MRLTINILILVCAIILAMVIFSNTAIISILARIGIYIFGSYVTYRIILKFDAEVGFLECLVPVWREYLWMRIITDRSVFYMSIIGLVLFLLTIFIDKIPLAIMLIIAFGICFMYSICFGILGEKLGKNFWLYTILGMVPIVNGLIWIKLAFDSSRPSLEKESIQ